MRLTYFGGPAWDGGALPARGRGQEALLFRLALDTATTVSYRALAEDVWPQDPPEDPRAALQSLASRLRRALPAGTLEAVSGGYRLTLSRDEIDLTRFQDLAASARHDADPSRADAALALWTGDPWAPDGFDWAVRDLLEDRAALEQLTRALPAVPSAPQAAPAVPAALTPLVGRADELDLVAAQLAAARLVTLIGPGGAGKTTLALETARRHAGAIVVELAPAAAGEVWPALAGAIGRSMRLSEAPTALDPREHVHTALSGRTVLVVLDNCEHVSAEAAAVALDLLRAVPGLRLLATSREPLGIAGEAFVDLGPLPEADAVELFSRRVRAARGTAPLASDRLTVQRIARRLDGLPLALELAAAKTRTLTLAEIDEGLDDRFALLAAGPRAADPRHQTLRALIDWSWEMLTEAERTALLASAVFPDGIVAADAPAVAAQFATDAAAFDSLVDRSLLHRSDGRFRLLETVREYGLDRLRGRGDDASFRADAARVLAELALRRDPLLRGPGVRAALAWFDANDENISAAARATADDPALHETGVRLVRGCFWAWAMRERFGDLSGRLALFASDDDPLESEPAVVVNGLQMVVRMFATAARLSMAAEAGDGTDDRAAELQQELFGDPPAEPEDVAALVARAQQISQAARAHASEVSLVLPPFLAAAARGLQQAEHSPPQVWGFDLDIDLAADTPLWTRAFVALLRTAFSQNAGEIQTLGEQSERALTMFREVGDVWGTAFASQMRSEWLMLHGLLDEALEVADASTRDLAGLTSAWDLLQQRSIGVNLLVRMGRFDQARERLESIRADAEADGSVRSLLQYGFTLGDLELAAGDGAAALRAFDTMPHEDAVGPERQILAWSAARRAQALLLLGLGDQARDELLRAIPVAMRTGDQPILAEAALTLAAWFAFRGADDTARRAFSLSVRLRGLADETDPNYRRLIERLGQPHPRDADGVDLDELMGLLEADAGSR
ncbi:ATP-binding protein [Microbacterium fluvii]|uniref:ATP-binding protein n=1 Tax=Microbacterium fluvii TaxID=415215 RepID=A0ABW2HFH1_9MICO|nr:ATPase [Microbacterium fluvii]MCU4672902.1 ATPase [Microbacterium fluvii]